MNIDIRWVRRLPLRASDFFASRLLSNRDKEQKSPKRELQDWENEGGNLTPTPEATDNGVTTGSA